MIGLEREEGDQRDELVKGRKGKARKKDSGNREQQKYKRTGYILNSQMYCTLHTGLVVDVLGGAHHACTWLGIVV